MYASIQGCQQSSNSASIECTTVLHTDILKAVTVDCTTVQHITSGVLKATGVQTLYYNLCQPVGHACPSQHELMLLLTQIVSTTMANFMLLYLSHHLAIWAQTLRADRACPDLALACIISCLGNPSHGCWAELCSAACCRYNLGDAAHQ